jgi:hypothetical protein
MNPETFVKEMNKCFKDLELLDPTWLRVVEELLTMVEVQDSQIRRLIDINKKLLAKKK